MKMNPEQDTRERILQTAFELFQTHGYDQVSLNDIIKDAEVSKGGLFHYFDSKYALARDSLMWWASNLMEPQFQQMMKEEMSPVDLLTSFVDMMMEIYRENSGFTRFFWGVFDESIRRKEDHSIWVRFLDNYVEMIASQYQIMGVKNPRERAMLFLASMDGLALYLEMLKSTEGLIDMEGIRQSIIDSYVDIEVRE
jgi:AcrR family transcriptional regulator